MNQELVVVQKLPAQLSAAAKPTLWLVMALVAGSGCSNVAVVQTPPLVRSTLMSEDRDDRYLASVKNYEDKGFTPARAKGAALRDNPASEDEYTESLLTVLGIRKKDQD